MEHEEWFGELEGSLEQFIGKPDNAFIRLDNVVWLEGRDEFEEPRIVRNTDSELPFEPYIYVRKSDIMIVRPLRYAINPPGVVD
jgi:hypothetical protein